MPATSQLEWLSSTTAMIVLFWSRATRDLLRSFGWGIAALHRENAATKLPFLAARPIASFRPFRDQCLSELVEPWAETTWRARTEFLRGGTNSSSPSPSSDESVSLPELLSRV